MWPALAGDLAAYVSGSVERGAFAKERALLVGKNTLLDEENFEKWKKV